MGSSATSKARAAYMHDADENEEPISGTRRTARQKPDASQLRPEKTEKKSKSDTGTKSYKHILSSGKSAPPTEKEIKSERRKSSASSPQKPPNRPPSAHKIRPKIAIPTQSDHPSYYGVPTPTSRQTPVLSQAPYKMMAAPIPLRPRAVTSHTYPFRPESFQGTYANGTTYAAPPISASNYYQAQLMAPSYPPPSPSHSYMRYAATPQPEYFPPQPMPGGRPLSSRFDSLPPRTASAFEPRETLQHNPVHRQFQIEDAYDNYEAYDNEYAPVSEHKKAERRASIRGPIPTRPKMRTKASDYDGMPPPARPTGILRNKTTDYHQELPDPPRERRQSRTFYHEEPPARRPSTHRHSASYDHEPETIPVRVETANTSHRRQSYYGQSASLNSGSGTGSSAWEEQAKAAQSYQAGVGASAPLTSEMLKRQQRRQAGSSRSTKSSGSHDESDYRRSATTRTTRSGSGQEHGNDDSFTIKVKGGQARIMVDGAQIDCTEGGEVQVQRQKSLRNGSERSNSVYGSSQIDDRERRPRTERLPGRSRMSSNDRHSHQRKSPEYHTGRDFTTDWV